jgi:hypothetical protein
MIEGKIEPFYDEATRKAGENSEGVISINTAKRLIENLSDKKSLELLRLFSETQSISLKDASKKMDVEEKQMKGYLTDITKTLRKITNNDNAWFYFWDDIEKKWTIANHTFNSLKKVVSRT